MLSEEGVQQHPTGKAEHVPGRCHCWALLRASTPDLTSHPRSCSSASDDNWGWNTWQL